jgi:hypothetical protein
VSRIKKIRDYIENMETVKYVLLMACVGYACSIILLNIVYFIKGVNFSQLGKSGYKNIFEEILYAIVLAPLIETFIFQSLVFTVSRQFQWLKDREILTILISATCFGLAHAIYNIYYAIYNIYYAISGFVVGIILAYSFSIYTKKKENEYIVVTLIHSFLNMISIIFSYTGLLLSH